MAVKTKKRYQEILELKRVMQTEMESRLARALEEGNIASDNKIPITYQSHIAHHKQ